MTTFVDKTVDELHEAVATKYADFYSHESELEQAFEGMEYVVDLHRSLNCYAMLPAASYLVGLENVPNLVKTCSYAWLYVGESNVKERLQKLMLWCALESEASLDDFRVLGRFHRDYGSAGVHCAKIALYTHIEDHHKRYLLEKLEEICRIFNVIDER